MPEKLTLYHFLKAAFHEKIKLPGMEQLPLNKILLSSAFLLGALNPWVWLLGRQAKASTSPCWPEIVITGKSSKAITSLN